MLKHISTTNNNHNTTETLSWHFLSIIKGDPTQNSPPPLHCLPFPPRLRFIYTQNLLPSIPLSPQRPLFASSYSTHCGFLRLTQSTSYSEGSANNCKIEWSFIRIQSSYSKSTRVNGYFLPKKIKNKPFNFSHLSHPPKTEKSTRNRTWASP